MKALTCAAARRRLAAFHDEELAMSDQVSVSAHLEWCDRCAEEFAELRLIRAAMRAACPGRQAAADHEDVGFQAAVLGRLKAEETVSVQSQMRAMFADLHLVYAGLGAAVAAVLCVVVMLSTMRAASADEPDSLAAMLRTLVPPARYLPGTNQNPVGISPDMRMPRALDDLFFAASSDAESGDEEFALTAVVTREGRVANVELLRASRVGRTISNAKDVERAEALLDDVSWARFQPASFSGAPVAVNMVWIVAHTTVRGSKPPIDAAAPLAHETPRPAKKRAASTTPAAKPATLV
jgi:anti-sigma factor ChrR (cupin superfamily)